MIWIAQDGTRYDIWAEFEELLKLGELGKAASGGCPYRLADDFKIQLKVKGKWVTVAEYESAEELSYVLSCYSVVEGFQHSFVFPHCGFYKEYFPSANRTEE